jgi:hypothetical protein
MRRFDFLVFGIRIIRLSVLFFCQLIDSMFQHYFRVLELKIDLIDGLEVLFKEFDFIGVVLELELDFIELVLKQFVFVLLCS